jgi:hypothetical protein
MDDKKNSGDWNSGNRNSGNRNSGNRNSGDWNSGDWNSGDWNSGDWNSGDWNSGNWNSGKWNSGNWNSGYLNSTRPPVRIFDQETNIKREDIQWPNYFYFDLITWGEDGSVCGGHLEVLGYKATWQKSWDKATPEDRAKTLRLPNFDAEKFLCITGIDVRKEFGENDPGLEKLDKTLTEAIVKLTEIKNGLRGKK